MVRKLFIYLDKDRRQQRVCMKEHRDGTKCRRVHSLPNDAIWSGLVPVDELGDFRADLKYARKAWRKKNRRWLRQLWNLRHVRAAPFAKAWVAKTIEKHLTERPQLEFKWPPKKK